MLLNKYYLCELEYHKIVFSSEIQFTSLNTHYSFVSYSELFVWTVGYDDYVKAITFIEKHGIYSVFKLLKKKQNLGFSLTARDGNLNVCT